MTRQDHFEITYGIPKDGSETIKSIQVTGAEKRDEIKAKIAKYGYRFVSCVKLYPFNMMNNQHNFFLIYNICYNRMDDMETGEIPYDADEYDALEKRRDKAGKFMTMGCAPVVWVPYDTWKDMKEMSTAAIIHRQNACIENGRPDLVTHC